MNNDRLGELLVTADRISPDQLDEALSSQREHGGRLGTHLIQIGALSEHDLAQFLSEQHGVPSVDVSEVQVDDAVLNLIPRDLCIKYTMIPVSRSGAKVTVAMADPGNVFALDDIKFSTGYNVEPVVATESQLIAAIDRYYGSVHAIELKRVMDDLREDEEMPDDLELLEEDDELDLDALEQQSGEAPVVRFVNMVLTDAVKKAASDIHLEPYERALRVRYRIDGVLHEMMNPPYKLREAITSRLKIMAKLDIAEKRLPQDGRIRVKTRFKGRIKDLDIRVSTLPTVHGEKVVLRLLDKDQLQLDMTKLGFEPESLRRFDHAIHQPYGMVLVTGPTGSGKTNTLYSALSVVTSPEVNVITAEDPVEFELRGINQVQMKERIGLNFASSLRSFLRQDPNIILVGEIRDFETAEVAIKAALTGHMVMSTLHTNDAPSSISRLMNMGVEPFLVATSVHMVVAQRLVRRVCTYCKEPDEIPTPALVEAGFSEREAKSVKLFRGKGCDRCSNTGYKGRIGLFEGMAVDEEVRELILSGATTDELRDAAKRNGMLTLRESGLEKIRNGVTSLEEVTRETFRH